ncbi:unnamed protein product, partial [marine sediment metagenome]
MRIDPYVHRGIKHLDNLTVSVQRMRNEHGAVQMTSKEIEEVSLTVAGGTEN